MFVLAHNIAVDTHHLGMCTHHHTDAAGMVVAGVVAAGVAAAGDTVHVAVGTVKMLPEAVDSSSLALVHLFDLFYLGVVGDILVYVVDVDLHCV